LLANLCPGQAQIALRTCVARDSRYRRVVRRPVHFLVLIFLMVATFSASAATGHVVKVLPHFLDLQGRHTPSPSLYDRDAYQLELRQHPERRSGIRFDILWRGRSAKKEPAKLRLELRGTAKGNLPSETRLETDVVITGTSHWVALKLDGEAYKQFGEVTAWRVTLWSGDQLLNEYKSFLW
jgi:hypothetical protein